MTTPTPSFQPLTMNSTVANSMGTPSPNLPGGGVNFPVTPVPQLNLSQFGSNNAAAVANFVNTLPPQQGMTSNIDTKTLAQSIIAAAGAQQAAQTQQQNTSGEGFMGHILDFLNIGTYSTAGAASGAADAWDKAGKNGEATGNKILDSIGGFLSGFGHGIAGGFGDSHPGDKVDWSDFLIKHGPDAAILRGDVKTMPDYAQNEANTFLNDQDGGHRPTNLTRPVTAADINKVAIANTIEGTGADMILDPFNFLKPTTIIKGITKAATFSKDLEVAKDAARVADPNNFENVLQNFDKEYAADKAASEAPGAASKGGTFGQGFSPQDLADPERFLGISKIPPNATAGDSSVGNAFRAGLQNALAGIPKSASDLVAPAANQMKIDPDAFNEMMKSVMEEAKPAEEETPKATGAVPRPNVTTVPTGAFSQMANSAHRVSMINGILSNALRNTGTPWAYQVAGALDNAVGDMNGLKFTNKYLDRMAKTEPDLNKIKAKIPTIRDALSRTLEADHNAHLVANKSLKAEQIVNAVSKGDKAAQAAAKPADAAVLKSGEEEIANSVYRDYEDQVGGSGHWTGMKDPHAYDKQLAANAIAKWSGPKQVNMFQTAMNRVREAHPGMPTPAVASAATRIQQHVESMFMAQGHVPYSAVDMKHAIPLRLSDVLYKVSPTILAKHADLLTTILRSAFGPAGQMTNRAIAKAAPELQDALDQAMEAGKAGSAIVEGDAAKQGLTQGEQIIQAIMSSGVSDARQAEGITAASKAGAEIAQQAGGSATAGRQVNTLLRRAYLESDKYQSAVFASRLRSQDALTQQALGRYSNVNDVNSALRQILGGPAIRFLGGVSGPQANAMGWLGGRIAGSWGLFGANTEKLQNFFGKLGEAFNPAWGNKDLRPMMVQAIASARAITGKYAQMYSDMYRQLEHDPDTLKQAMLMAQGHKPTTGDAAEWAKAFQTHMENMLGSDGLTRDNLIMNTVAGRGQLLMAELNAAVKRFGITGKFSNANKVVDAMGNTHDLSKGVDWLKSWQTWKIDNPLKFMMQMTNAVSHATREAKMWDEIASRFGKIGATTIPKFPRLAGVSFDADHAAQVRQLIKNLEDFKKPSSKFPRLLDAVLSKYKTAATMYLPAHHLRALIGDVYLAWLDGVGGSGAYSDASRIMRAQLGRYKNFGDINDLTGSDALDSAIARISGKTGAAPARGSDVVFTMKNGQKVSADMVYTYMFQHGLLPNGHQLLDIPEEDAMAKMMTPFNGKVHDFVNAAAETREHFVRIAHFVDKMKKSSGSWEEAANKASADVRKWHPDGTDLTNFERRVVRRVFPFYSWSRKAVPLIMESLLARPAKISAYPRISHLMGVMTGAQNPMNTSEEDPFPPDQLFPDWMQEKGVGPMFGSYQVAPNIPSMDIIEQLGGLTSGNQSERANAWSSLVNPALRIPEELLTGQTLGGSSIESARSGLGQYLLRQIPQVQQYASISNITANNQITHPSGTLNVEKLLNFLAAAGIENSQDYERQASSDYMTQQRIGSQGGW